MPMFKSIEDPLLFRFFNEIGIIEQLSRTKLESVLPHNLKMSHFIMINHLSRLEGEWSPNRLARAFQVTKAAITNTLKRLESDGLVEVNSDPSDGRGKLVSLTSKGYSVREQCIQNLGPLLIELEKELDTACILTALPILEDVRKYLDDHR